MRTQMNYNIHEGILESMVHGYRNGFLGHQDYTNICQCESLNDLKSQMQVTEYGNFLQSATVVTSKLIAQKALEKMVNEFLQLREWSEEPLSTFLDFISYEHMISNVLKLIAAKRGGNDSLDILFKLHPLGMFHGIETLTAATDIGDMFETVLIDCPIGRFFMNSQQKDFDELSLEYIRGLLQRNYIESFYDFCLSIGGETATMMCPMLEFEADRGVIITTANTCGMRDIQPNDRRKLYPNIGTLVDVQDDISTVEDVQQLKERLKRFPEYFELMDDDRTFNGASGGKSLERKFVDRGVQHYKDLMSRQFQYGVFYGWLKLKEIEISNLQWISDCISQNMKTRVTEYVHL
eukprot:Tbor_TRINITY_DN3343_c0_g1::TRINITY_DN3343_c0_g1_i1::g.23489::m.23489/K02146/ATPeV0D, ATP6D; V-type H+-transporting ATPase subunit d